MHELHTLLLTHFTRGKLIFTCAVGHDFCCVT